MTKREQCEILYKDAFGESGEFDSMLFDLFFDYVETSETNGIVTAMYFKIPCTLRHDAVKKTAYYIYAVTTHKDHRHKGLMSKLFDNTTTEPDTLYFLKPSSEGVIKFYEQAGFTQIIGTRKPCNAIIEVNNNFKALSRLCDKPQEIFPIMIKGIIGINQLTFEYTLE